MKYIYFILLIFSTLHAQDIFTPDRFVDTTTVGLYDQWGPSIAISKDGTVGIAWIDQVVRANNWEWPVQFIKYDVEADSFYGKVTVYNKPVYYGSYRFNTMVKFDTAGHPIVLWEYYDAELYNAGFKVARSYDYGDSFSQPFLDEAESDLPSVFLSAENDFYLAWEYSWDNPRDILFTRINNCDTNNIFFNTASLDTLYTGYYYNIFTRNDTTYILWIDWSDQKLYSIKSYDKGTSFQPHTNLYQSKLKFYSIQSQVYQDDIYLTFDVKKDTMDTIYLYFSKSISDSFKTPVEFFTKHANLIGHKNSCNYSSGFLTTFIDNGEAWLMRSKDFSGNFEKKILIGLNHEFTGSDKIAQDNNGNIFLVNTKEIDIAYRERVIFNRGNMLINSIPFQTTQHPESGFLKIYPNPFNREIKIELTALPKTIHKIIIYNILGEKVYSFDNIKYGINGAVYFWDGRNNNGNELPSGIYIVSVTGNNFNLAKKIIYLK